MAKSSNTHGYIGASPTQLVTNTGVHSVSDALELSSEGKWGGSLELIAQQTFSSVTEVDFTGLPTDEYEVIVVHAQNIEHTSANKFTFAQFYESGVLESAAVYHYAHQYGDSSGTFGELKSIGNNYIYLTWTNHGTATNDTNGFYTYFYNLGDSSKYSYATLHDIIEDNGVAKFSFGGGVLPQTSTVDGIRFGFNTASTDGTIKIYGVKQI